ncbi:hypothetical protein L7F22_061161 [Adiantum nelumboides]|nr:hypothetical protein [Adiantum nelumboides]
MLSSWFTKLRDVKTEFKHSKQQDTLHVFPLTTSEKRQDTPLSLARSFSLRRASSKARSGPFESDACRNECNLRPFVSTIESDLCKSRPDVCDSQSYTLHKEATDVLMMQNCSNQLDSCQSKGTSHGEVDAEKAYVGGNDGQTIAKIRIDGRIKSMLDEENQAVTQKGHGASDSDLEELVFTSECSSIFESEMSSADSSTSSKCSNCEGSRGSQIWQRCVRSSESMDLSLKKNCGRLHVANVTKEHRESSGCSELAPNFNQVTAETQPRPILNVLQETRQHTLVSSPFSINVGEDGRTFPSYASKGSPNSSETRKRCIFARTFLSSTGKHESDSRLRLEGDEGCALLNGCSRGQQEADWRMPCGLNGRREMNAEANFVLELSEDKYRACTFDDFNWAVNQSSSPKAMEFTHSLSQDIAITPCADQIGMGEDFPGKYTTAQMQRRRQRGSSISAVLPPDLQGVVGDSLAFVQMSDDPYEDFKQSMYEMIMEKDLEGSMDVEELLYCYLTLNSTEHHELIKEVFSDVWSAVLMAMR